MSDDQREFNGGQSGSALKIVIIIIVALLGLGSCCGVGILGVFYFENPNENQGAVLQQQIQGIPVIQTHIGQLDDLKVDAGQGRIAFDVSGSKGSGRLLVETGEGTLANADWAIIVVDEKPYVVFGEPPADSGAEIFPDTGNASTDDTNDDVDDSNP